MDAQAVCPSARPGRKLLVMKQEKIHTSRRASLTGQTVRCVMALLVQTLFSTSSALAQVNTQSANVSVNATASDSSFFHTSTLLADGRVLMVSGGGKSSVVSSAGVYDPASQALTPTSPLNNSRVQATATRLANGKVLVVGGYGNNG
jgi:hypothetical protein